MLNIAEISPQRPLVINTYGELLQVHLQIMTDAGVLKQNQVPEVQQELITTKQAKKLLAAKGWQVKSHVGFKSAIGELQPVRRGREDWWRLADIESIPSKNI